MTCWHLSSLFAAWFSHGLSGVFGFIPEQELIDGGLEGNPSVRGPLRVGADGVSSLCYWAVC